MKELVVVSGKGGTGKTSVTVSLAALAGSVVLADCDVDAADLHLVCGAVGVEAEPFVSGHEARVVGELCTGCGRCESLCRFGAISVGEDRATVSPHVCEGCRVCVDHCPAQAISFVPRRCGESYLSVTRLGPLSHARLLPGADNSGKLVTLVRRRARELAQKEGADWLIVDGPPGIGCPVIAAITGADAVLLVTEPSLSARSDLERVARLCRHFSLPVFCLINRCDIHAEVSRQIEADMAELGVPVIGKIPYDQAFTRAQLAGLSLVETGRTSLSAMVLHSAWAFLKKEILQHNL